MNIMRKLLAAASWEKIMKRILALIVMLGCCFGCAGGKSANIYEFRCSFQGFSAVIISNGKIGEMGTFTCFMI